LFLKLARTQRPAHARRSRGHVVRSIAGLALAATLVSACSRETTAPPWHLADVTGHLPNLQFSLTADNGQPVTGKSFLGQTTFVYFGYTHCPDVSPQTMARLMQVLAKLGPDAKNVRILFITVDPARDTAAALHAYVDAFDPQHAVGLTGTGGEIESLARRYRVAYQAEARAPDGSYEVTHSSAVYVFDAQGHARLLATDNDKPDVIAEDVRRVIDDTH
jgi:protein SCO1/2